MIFEFSTSLHILLIFILFLNFHRLQTLCFALHCVSNYIFIYYFITCIKLITCVIQIKLRGFGGWGKNPKHGHFWLGFWVLKVKYAWEKISELTWSQKTHPRWMCFEFSGGGGNGWGWGNNPKPSHFWLGFLDCRSGVCMGEGKQSHPKPENMSHMGMFFIFGWGRGYGGVWGRTP